MDNLSGSAGGGEMKMKDCKLTCQAQWISLLAFDNRRRAKPLTHSFDSLFLNNQQIVFIKVRYFGIHNYVPIGLFKFSLFLMNNRVTDFSG